MNKKLTSPYTCPGLADFQSHYGSAGDVIFVKKGLKKIIGRGVVTSNYIFDESREEYRHIHNVNWTNKGEWDHEGQIVMKTLTNITPYTDDYKRLEDMFAATTDEVLILDDEVSQYDS